MHSLGHPLQQLGRDNIRWRCMAGGGHLQGCQWHAVCNYAAGALCDSSTADGNIHTHTAPLQGKRHKGRVVACSQHFHHFTAAHKYGSVPQQAELWVDRLDGASTQWTILMYITLKRPRVHCSDNIFGAVHTVMQAVHDIRDCFCRCISSTLYRTWEHKNHFFNHGRQQGVQDHLSIARALGCRANHACSVWDQQGHVPILWPTGSSVLFTLDLTATLCALCVP